MNEDVKNKKIARVTTISYIRLKETIEIVHYTPFYLLLIARRYCKFYFIQDLFDNVNNNY